MLERRPRTRRECRAIVGQLRSSAGAKPASVSAPASAVGIRAPDLMREDRLARLDQFVAGGEDGDARRARRLRASARPCRRGDRDFGGAEPMSRLEQPVAGRASRAATMHMALRSPAPRRIAMREPSAISTCSTGTTVSQPCGITAPVMTSKQSASSRPGREQARRRPACRRCGIVAPAMARRQAMPSMATRSKGGASRSACSASRRMRPARPASGTAPWRSRREAAAIADRPRRGSASAPRQS